MQIVLVPEVYCPRCPRDRVFENPVPIISRPFAGLGLGFCIPSMHRLEGILAEPVFYGNVCWSGVRAGVVRRVPVVPVCDDALTEAQPFDGYLVSCTIAFRRK